MPITARLPDETDHSTSQRARQLVDTALSHRRFAGGLSAASPTLRAFGRAGACSLLLWSMLLLAALSV